MKICIINPAYLFHHSEDEDYSYSGFTLPHLGIGYIASFLQKEGYSVDVYECMGQNIGYDELYNKLSVMQYDMIGLSIYEGNRKAAFRIINYISNNLGNTFIFAGGYTATLASEQLLRTVPAIRCCILGEGESTVLELVKKYSQKSDWKKVSGIAYLQDGIYIKTEKRELIGDLDKLPFPRRVFMNKNKMVSMITSRGCSGNCTYCSIVSQYRKCSGKMFRNRSGHNVVDEMRYLYDEYGGIRDICFFDDNFLEDTAENNRKIDEMISLCKKYHVYIPFSITACAKDIIRMQDKIMELKAIGLYKVFIGVESFVQRQLDFYNKMVCVLDNIKAIQIIQDYSLEISLGLIAFDPYVTIDEILTNFNMLAALRLENSGLTPFSWHTYLVAVRGTPVMHHLEKEGKFVPNERGYKFENEEIEIIYNYIEKWHVITKPMISKSYWIEYAKENLGEKEELQLKTIYRKYIQLDIEYVLALCNAAQKKKGLSDILKCYENNFIIIFQEYQMFWENCYEKTKNPKWSNSSMGTD